MSDTANAVAFTPDQLAELTEWCAIQPPGVRITLTRTAAEVCHSKAHYQVYVLRPTANGHVSLMTREGNGYGGEWGTVQAALTEMLAVEREFEAERVALCEESTASPSRSLHPAI